MPTEGQCQLKVNVNWRSMPTGVQVQLKVTAIFVSVMNFSQETLSINMNVMYREINNTEGNFGFPNFHEHLNWWISKKAYAQMLQVNCVIFMRCIFFYIIYLRNKTWVSVFYRSIKYRYKFRCVWIKARVHGYQCFISILRRHDRLCLYNPLHQFFLESLYWQDVNWLRGL